MANDPEPNSTRIQIDLTPEAAAEKDLLRAMTGASTATLVRTALVVLKMVVDAKAEGKETVIGGCRIELPFTVRKQTP